MQNNRIPHEFFETKGIGESDLEVHAGSYHYALHSAGISDYNIITYSSTIPADAQLVEASDWSQPFGSELSCIMSVCNGEESELLSAGIVYGWLHDDNGVRIGGLACEVSGCYPQDELIYRLETVIKELHVNTYSEYTLNDLRYITTYHVPQKRYGTALVALCFISFKE